jgi:excisionase family DNA binding protein
MSQPDVPETAGTREATEIPPVMTITELAAILRIGKTMAYELCQSRQIRSFKIGKNVRVFREDLTAWINSQREAI